MVHPPAPETTGRPATEATRSTRQRLLAAAYEVLVDEGYQAATVQNVARRANLTTGAIYANFTSKHELLVQAVLERWAQSPGLNPLQLLRSPAAETPGGLRALDGLEALEESDRRSGGPDDVASESGRAGDTPSGPAGSAHSPGSSDQSGPLGLHDLVEFLADQITAAPAPEHRLLTEVTGAAIRHDVAMSRLRAGILLVESFARDAIVRAQAEGRLDERFPTDVLVTLAVNVYLGSITSKSFNLPQPSREALYQVLDLLQLVPGDPAASDRPVPDREA